MNVAPTSSPRAWRGAIHRARACYALPDQEETLALIMEARPVNYRGLMKKVEQVVAAMERGDDVGRTVHTVVDTIIVKFHDELGIYGGRSYVRKGDCYVLEGVLDRKSTRLNSSHSQISYAVFCLKKKKKNLHSNRVT